MAFSKLTKNIMLFILLVSFAMTAISLWTTWTWTLDWDKFPDFAQLIIIGTVAALVLEDGPLSRVMPSV